jgi:ParB family transcriptional regulator, chromosome partitioning protein
MNRRQEVLQVPVDLIRPGHTQARRRFDQAALAELAESIRESGVVQPVVLRSAGRGYELLAGERRWRAAQLAGLHEIPALVRDDLTDSEAYILGLIENLQRESLSPIETAEGLRRLGETFGLRHEDIGQRIGKSRAYVTNHLRLLALAEGVQKLVDQGLLSLGHAKVLAGLAPERQPQWAQAVLRDKLSVRALEQRLAQKRAPVRRSGGDWDKLAQKLSEHLGYPASFKPGAKGAGELRLRFHSLDELDGLLERMGYREN